MPQSKPALFRQHKVSLPLTAARVWQARPQSTPLPRRPGSPAPSDGQRQDSPYEFPPPRVVSEKKRKTPNPNPGNQLVRGETVAFCSGYDARKLRVWASTKRDRLSPGTPRRTPAFPSLRCSIPQLRAAKAGDRRDQNTNGFPPTKQPVRQLLIDAGTLAAQGTRIAAKGRQ